MTAQRSVSMLNLKAQHASIAVEVSQAVLAVLESQSLILGPEVAALEKELAEYCQVAHAVGCGSGSDALFLALLALDVGPGDEVLTTPYTFFATAGAIHRTGARVVFADVDPRTFNLDPDAAAAVMAARPNVKAMIPVHLFGACAEMEPLLKLASNRGIPVVEDAAQAIGAEYLNKRAGSMGDIGCFSFYPTKNLGGAGEGGLMTTNDARLAERLKSLRVHGSSRRYYHDEVGINSRLDTLQAAVLRVKLKHLDRWTAKRQENAALYNRLLAESGAPVTTPFSAPSTTRHVVNQYVVLASRRDELKSFLRSRGIGCEIYYPLPLHLQTCFSSLGYRPGDFAVSEQIANSSLALPVHAELSEEDIAWVAESITEFYR